MTPDTRLLELLDRCRLAHESGQPFPLTEVREALGSNEPESPPTMPPTEESPRTVPPLADASVPATVAPKADARNPDRPAESVLAGGMRGYQIVSELGRGGMGVVYKAYQVGLNRVVALKMIRSGDLSDAGERQRFLDEATSAAAVHHPAVVEVYQIGEQGGLPFLAMEYCPGGSLADRLTSGPLPPAEAARLLERVACGLQAAHDKGIVHRDLKPGNILLVEQTGDSTGGSRTGSTLRAVGSSRSEPATLARPVLVPKITDFGLAKRLDAVGLTRTGAVMGTPAYMAPEQARDSKSAGPPADVYALGAVLYECLTGRPPFQAATAAETLMQVLSYEPPSPRALNRSVPADLETICLKCLSKEPGKRYASAAELADDLGRWMRHEPIQARPAGRVERAVKWARRRPTSAAFLATGALGALLVATLAIVATVEWREAQDALKRRDVAERKHALAQIDALCDAAPGAVPGILASLAGSRDEVLSELRQRHEPENDPARKARLALALLPVDADGVRDELVARMLKAEDPAEAVLVRDALSGHATGLAPRLWEIADDAKKEPGERFHALVGLAAFDPKNERWKGVARRLVEQLLGENPLHLGTWVQALFPVRAALAEPLGEVFRDGTPEQRVTAAQVLRQYIADQPETLYELLLDANGKQYVLLRPLLEKDRAKAAARMHAELAKQPDYWKDAPLDASRKRPNAAIVTEVEKAGGLVAERFALCQALPLDRLAAVTEAMRTAGYRPQSVRPWSSPLEVSPPLVALVWARDGRDWKLESALTLEALKQRDAHWQKAGLIPADVAAYATKDGIRYLGLWRKGEKDEKTVLYASVPEDKHQSATKAFEADGYVPARVQALVGDGESYAGVWWKGKEKVEGWNLRRTEEGLFAGHVADGERLLLDVHLGPAAPVRHTVALAASLVGVPALALPGFVELLRQQGLARYASVWRDDTTRQAEALQGLSAEAHLARCRELAAQSYRPLALSLAHRPGERGPLAASVWHRPIDLPGKDALARRQAITAATLLALNQPKQVWPLFRHSADPTRRSYLVWKAGELGSDPRQIIAQLESEKDDSARRALILALGEYREKDLPSKVRAPLVKRLLGWYRDDPDPGVHAAIGWLMRHKSEGATPRLLDWGQAKELDAIDKELAGKKACVLPSPPGPLSHSGERGSKKAPAPPLPPGWERGPGGEGGDGWYVTAQGQTMVMIRGPIEFRMGSPLWEPDRVPVNERPHVRRIERHYALASTPVTVAQYRLFLKDRPHVPKDYPTRHSPEDGGPIVFVSWYAAAEYCNWLSEKEGIPPEQWCYPKKIGSGMRMEPGYLDRTGYRLPTEAEWEFACKAGSGESRPFGSALELLPRYAQYQSNSKDRTWPVGQKRPNEKGLFDMQGNVWNLCQDKALRYPQRRSAMSTIDTEDATVVDESNSRVLRGGSFDLHAPDARPSFRYFYRPDFRDYDFGLRVCRTLPAGSFATGSPP